MKQPHIFVSMDRENINITVAKLEEGQQVLYRDLKSLMQEVLQVVGETQVVE